MKKILLLIICVVSLGCEIENINPLVPILITDEPVSIGSETAVLGGRVLGEGGVAVSEYGIVYSQIDPPTIADTKISLGDGIGIFSDVYDEFDANTTYYYAAYGINAKGTGYGETFAFTTDIEPSCNPANDNVVDLGPNTIGISNVEAIDSFGFNDGNVGFETSTFNSAVRITVLFKESNSELPLSGVYTTVGEFDNQSLFSDGEIKLSISDFSIGGFGGGIAGVDQSVFVENDGTDVTIILCDVVVGDNYILNGKFTYTD